ncbi:hypothetical protein DPMN_018933 [Dreissena polymorpha]|uniref:Uncharacterized protein n=1 Tax=Dreissena polymorpha TaxID=45954 RepID=A0A9D4NJE5_DREPO|nr:hypothetical protein DPMN_168622 [Dreissena polymorpha]KAH3894774.1 hypothetical protein DPMN_018933 [Dreissena polymorpha]
MRKELVFCSQRNILTTPTQPLHLNRQPEYQGVKFVLDAVTVTAFKPAAVDVLRFSPLHVI